MDINNPHNQSYWFVLKEDQSNVIFSTNNFTIQNPQISGHETRYIVDTSDNRQYIQISDVPVAVQEEVTSTCEKSTERQTNEDNFWDRNKIKLLLTLCLDNRFKNAAKDKAVWTEIASIIGTSPEECNKKYRNLRRTYIRLLKKKQQGKDIKWVHYSMCEEVFLKECKSLSPTLLESWDDSRVRRLLTLYIENLHKFRDPNCLQKDVWREIALALNTTDYNCYHKFKNLKRTYLNWLERSRESGKLIKWAYHIYFERIYYNYNPSLRPWDKDKIRRLIDSYLEIAHKFRNSRFQKKELWKEISLVVGESPACCDRKFRNLKQTYIRLKMKANTGITVTKWRYYRDFEAIYNILNNQSSGNGTINDSPYKYQEQDYVEQLLTFYVENRSKFRDPLVKKKNLWRIIGRKLGLSSEECARKFRNLKQTYIRLREKKTDTGKCNKWPYYSYFEQIYDEPSIIFSGNDFNDETDSVAFSEIRRVMREMQDRHNGNKFDKLIEAVRDSNSIQRERNRILKELLEKN